MKALLIVLSCLGIVFQTAAQIPYLHLSPIQKLEQRVGMTDVTIVYSRPHMRGRTIFGDLVPFDSLWRTGANRNSKITFSKPVTINNTKVNTGTYAIITRPGKSKWDVIFYKELTHWEVPSPWDEEQIAAQISVPSTQTARTAARLTFSIDDFNDDEATLALHWENTRIEVPIDVNTEEKIRAVLAGPSASDYHRAAEYSLIWDKDLEDGLKWAQLSIDMREKKEYWQVNLKAKLLAKLGRYEEALATAKAAFEGAKASSSDYGMNKSKVLIAEYENALKK
ncbi:MAG: DUF2911 domain-containing protein [Saprospiraceae bacterium]